MTAALRLRAPPVGPLESSTYLGDELVRLRDRSAMDRG